jgi:hypothetical protein
MTDALATVLRLVEAGDLSPEEATEIIAALEHRADPSRPSTERAEPTEGGPGRPRSLRVEVTDGGRSVVNLRLPASIGELALLRIPGLSRDDTARIREALRVGLAGDLVRAMDDEGNGVRIAVE